VGLSGALVGAIACATRSRSDRSLIVVNVYLSGRKVERINDRGSASRD